MTVGTIVAALTALFPAGCGLLNGTDGRPGIPAKREAAPPPAPLARAGTGIVFDNAPGHAAVEGTTVRASGGVPGAAWWLLDWRGRAAGVDGAFDSDGRATIPPLPAGYYRMLAGEVEATLAVVAPAPGKPGGAGDATSAFAADTALSLISRRGAFRCPWNDGDTERTVADLVRLAGWAHVRERLRWGEVQKSPDAPPDFSRYIANAELFRERGAAVSGMFHDAPPWTAPLEKLPDDLGALNRFCREAAAAFGDRMEDWEFWNEQDIHFAPEPAWEYVAAMKAAYLGFKAARPEMPVLNGALCQMPGKTRYFEAFFDNDAALYCDVFNYHTYLPPAKYHEAFAGLRALLAASDAGDLPIWVTEFGTNLEGHSNRDGVKKGMKAHSPRQELVHAEFFPKAQIAMQMEGVSRAYFFVMAAYNERGGRKDWGAIRRDGTVKPVFSAIATAIRELDGARLVGALGAPAGIRAYLFERPDGAQTVAFWSESPMDTVEVNSKIVKPEPDFTRTWQLANDGAAHPPASLRLVDMCGMASPVALDSGDGRPDAATRLTLTATRYPAYLSGLRGLKAAVAPHAPPRPAGGRGRKTPPSPIVLRPVLDRADFGLSGGKTLAVMNGDTGRMRLQVWNFSDVAQTGTVDVAGAIVSGLPGAPFTIDPGACAQFDCAISHGGFAKGAASRPLSEETSTTLRFSGEFNGRATSRAVVPLFFEKIFLENCTRMPLATDDPALWAANSSADEHGVSFDEAEGAVRFDSAWGNLETDRWVYPTRQLRLPVESPEGAVMFAFEVKSSQDKVENDFKTSKLMLASDDGTTDIYLDYDPPTREWEKRFVDVPQGTDLSKVTRVRIGANPLGSRCTIWLRNLEMLK